MKLTLREIESCIQALEFELAGDFMPDVDEAEATRVVKAHHSASAKLKTERDRRLAKQTKES